LSIGLDRLIPALEDLKLMPESSTVIQAMVVNFDESLTDEYLKMSSQLRSANINTMLYYETADLKKQLAYASDRGIPYAIMYGPNEAKDKVVMIKDLQKGTQEKVNLVDLMKYFSK
jgi:histidyl-tRNA synthetase